MFAYTANNLAVKSQPHHGLKDDITTPLRWTREVSLDHLCQEPILASVEELLAKEGSMFTTGMDFRARPTNKKHIRLAAQCHDVIITNQSMSKVQAISFTTCYAAQCGLFTQVFFFCNQDDNDVGYLLAHIYLTMERLTLIIGTNDLGLQVNFPLHMDSAEVETALNRVFGSRRQDVYPGAITAVQGTITVCKSHL